MTYARSRRVRLAGSNLFGQRNSPNQSISHNISLFFWTRIKYEFSIIRHKNPNWMQLAFVPENFSYFRNLYHLCSIRKPIFTDPFSFLRGLHNIKDSSFFSYFIFKQYKNYNFYITDYYSNSSITDYIKITGKLRWSVMHSP